MLFKLVLDVLSDNWVGFKNSMSLHLIYYKVYNFGRIELRAVDWCNVISRMAPFVRSSVNSLCIEQIAFEKLTFPDILDLILMVSCFS